MRAIVLSCTLKPSAAASNTEALTGVLTDALEAEGVETELMRVVDHDVKPGVESDMGDGDDWPAIRERLLAAEYTIPGQAWTYWNRGPGPGDDYLDADAGKDWSHSTGRDAAANLLAVARALATGR